MSEPLSVAVAALIKLLAERGVTRGDGQGWRAIESAERRRGAEAATALIHTMDRGLEGSRRIARSRAHVAAPTINYRLDVVAATVIDAVESAGGLICDRTIAGWDVSVILAEQPDRLPLQILGANVIDLQEALNSGETGPFPHTVAAAADLLGSDSRVRRGVSRLLADRSVEVMLWGEPRNARLGSRRFLLAEHRLSLAARAFKARALAAAATPAPSIELSEKFHARGVAGTSATSDLIPAS